MAQFDGVTGQYLISVGIAPDGSQKPIRVDRFGSLMTFRLGGGFSALAGEGTYFRACNPTMGTGIAGAATASFADTATLLCLRNTSASADGPTIYMDYIRLICTATGTGGTSFNAAVVIEGANRYSSAGTQLTPANCNSGFSTASIADLRFGAVVASAAGSKRTISRMMFKTQAAPCMVVGDQYYLNFGSNASGMGALNGSAAQQFAVDCGPAALGPNGNHSLLLHSWWPSISAAASFEVEVAWWER